tara:strand:+ start:1765 stop:1950 length:186 start_codon:yes stop_codon:yes gene_type:complete
VLFLKYFLPHKGSSPGGATISSLYFKKLSKLKSSKTAYRIDGGVFIGDLQFFTIWQFRISR